MSVDVTQLPPRYLKPEQIARGGMGEVYRAEDSQLARVVAIKVLSDRYADEEATRGRFTREALAAARLSNAPHTVTIFDVGEHEGRPYIVMEFLPGGSLAARVAEEGAQPLGRALRWLEEAAAAIDAAHANGIVHRDVKPENLLLDAHDRVKVADFGVASAVGLSSFTEAGTVVGTAGYLAPEQARGEKATPASDRYALAVVAFELLTGERPFERDTPTAEAMAHVSSPVPPASSYNPELPRAVDAILARGLAKQPEHRFESGAAFVNALRGAVDSAEGRTTVAAIPAVVPQRRRSPLPIVLATLAALLLAGIVAATLLAGRDDERTAGTTLARTVKQTVTATLEGTTIRQTVTSAPEPAPEPEPEQPTGAGPSELNDQGFALMQAGRYDEALPLLEQAVTGLSGSGELSEAYASYNLAFTRLALGSCDGVAELLERSEAVQGRRKEIDRLRREVERSCDD